MAQARTVAPGLDETSAKVVIHHSPFTDHGSFETYAVIDATTGTAGTTAHLNDAGAPIVFDYEIVATDPAVAQ